MAGTASSDSMEWNDDLKKKAKEAIAQYTARRIQATPMSVSNTFVSSSTTGSLMIQPPIPTAVTTTPDEPEVPSWDSVVAAAFGWATIDPSKASVMLEIAKEIRRHEDQEAKLFKKLRKQLELEAANDGDS